MFAHILLHCHHCCIIGSDPDLLCAAGEVDPDLLCAAGEVDPDLLCAAGEVEPDLLCAAGEVDASEVRRLGNCSPEDRTVSRHKVYDTRGQPSFSENLEDNVG